MQDFMLTASRPAQIMKEALSQAKDGRIHILNEMSQALNKSRETISEFAPTITTLQVHKDKIRDVIGKGGVVIREITEKTGAKIEINDVIKEGEIVHCTITDINKGVLNAHIV